MTAIKTPDSTYFISINNFDICLIDGKTRKEITILYPSRINGAYYLDKFVNYLRDNYNISLRDYCIKYLNFKWPQCPVKKELTGYIVSGSGLKISRFVAGGVTMESCPKFKTACEKASQDRTGSKNPMYGKEAWNKGLDISDPRVQNMVNKNIGRSASEETKIKQSEAGKRRKIHGHTGHKHSDLTKEQLRQNTARLWSVGIFNKVTSIHIKVREFLLSLDLSEKLEEEYQVKYFSMDFAFPDVKVAIECQGTYYHIDPRRYPNGPINAMQRRNKGRDKAKRTFCCGQLGWIIIELWETEINNGQFKDILLCKLQELNLLKK